MNCSSSLLRAATSWGLTAGEPTASSCSSFRRRWAWWASCRSRALSQWARSRRDAARSRTALSLSASCSSSQPSATRREQSPLVSMERLNSRRDCKKRVVQLRMPPRMPPGCVPAYPSFTHPSIHSPVHPSPAHLLLVHHYFPCPSSTNLSYLSTHSPTHVHLSIHPVVHPTAVHPSTLICPSLPCPSASCPSPTCPLTQVSTCLFCRPHILPSSCPSSTCLLNTTTQECCRPPLPCWRHGGQHQPLNLEDKIKEWSVLKTQESRRLGGRGVTKRKCEQIPVLGD